jgi:flagellar biosynthesis protein FliR
MKKQRSLGKVLTVRIDYLDVARFLAILLRLSLVVFLVPPFSNLRVPARIKASYALVFTLVLFPVLGKEVAPLSFQPGQLICMVAGEVIFGMLMALAVTLILGAFELAGEVISYLAGLTMAQVVDPQGGFQITVVGNLLELMALLLLLALNGHHVLLKIIVESFRTIPVGQFILNTTTIDRFILFSGQLFIIGIKLAAPVAMVLFLIEVGLGILNRFIPNINIMMTSFPITIGIGLFFVGLALPFWGEAMMHSFHQVFRFLQNILELHPTGG